MAVVGMDIVTADGTNADLVDPIVSALLSMSITPADISDPADSDLASADVAEFLDRAELRLLENILGNYDMVNISEGPRSESLSQFADALERLIDRKQKKVEADYGALDSLSGGVIVHNFQAKADD